jgi:histidine phosphotransferase ChpT
MGDTDLLLAQLLCTRLCHDLAGPVGAVAAGVELIGGDPAQADTETLGLIGNSSAAASLKLKFMRSALGVAGGGTTDPRALLDGYLDAIAGPSGKPVLSWPGPDALAAGSSGLGVNWVQNVLNLCLLALETQPSCRALSLRVAAGPDLAIIVTARGAPERPTALREDLAAAVAERAPPALSAKTVHANLAGRLVRAAGGTITLASNGNEITVTAVYPAKASVRDSGYS